MYSYYKLKVLIRKGVPSQFHPFLTTHQWMCPIEGELSTFMKIPDQDSEISMGPIVAYDRLSYE